MANRRNWLKQMGLASLGLGFSGFKAAESGELIPMEPPGKPIRLIANENPYGPSPFARKAMADAVGLSNRYNGELTTDLIKGIARQHQLLPENILVGAGSTQILDWVALYASLQKGSCVVPQPSFDYWSYCSEKNGLRKIGVPLTQEKAIDLQAVLAAIQPDTRLIYICNPNNPTGTQCHHDTLVAFLEEATKKALVLVDEAYMEFTDQPSVCHMVINNKNLVIAKTFSKVYGLAGARVGYALAHPDMIQQLSDLSSWPNGNHSVVSTAAAIAALKDEEFVKKTVQLNQQNRQFTIAALEKINLRCIASHTNFIYFSLANYNGDFFERLKAGNILGTGIFEKDGKWSRITIGTKQEMEQFIKAVS
ncbi:MAG: aminotransferase class I/II-fold pyridoxal phosphate-dependent enzyme [Chitinophagaceae bacterium]|nr:aminotransferase class I/II-fold pyridoxal phosphate-dependent enzyme [Chitinophagaceae bacterium]MCW5925732.1 aminotransferase class I/II-fold pyridoxal phosphate-dependent enzyme [Chitinophagaceae bacterium]